MHGHVVAAVHDVDDRRAVEPGHDALHLVERARAARSPSRSACRAPRARCPARPPARRAPGRARRPRASPGAAMSRALDSSTVAISRSPFTRSVEPVDTRSTITSAMPRCGAISAAPETGTTSTALPALGEELRGDAREDGRHARAGRQVPRCVVRPLSSRRRHDEAAAPERQVRELVEVASGLAHEVPPGDAGVRRAVGDELGDVLRAHEERLELAAERGGQRARTAARTSSPASVNSSRASSERRPLLGSAIRSMVAKRTEREMWRGDRRKKSPSSGTGCESIGAAGGVLSESTRARASRPGPWDRGDDAHGDGCGRSCGQPNGGPSTGQRGGARSARSASAHVSVPVPRIALRAPCE